VRNYFNSSNSEEKYVSDSFWFWDSFFCLFIKDLVDWKEDTNPCPLATGG